VKCHRILFNFNYNARHFSQFSYSKEDIFMDEQLKKAALDFHEFPIPGKIEVTPTKSLATQRDLALAYSPGVAAPCLAIQADPADSYK